MGVDSGTVVWRCARAVPRDALVKGARRAHRIRTAAGQHSRPMPMAQHMVHQHCLCSPARRPYWPSERAQRSSHLRVAVVLSRDA